MWLFIWVFLPHSVDINLGLALTLLAAGFVYNLAVTIASSVRYKMALSALTFTVDSLAITVAVFLSGGIGSELWPLYFILVMSASMTVDFSSEVMLFLYITFLYLLSTLADITSVAYFPLFLNRLFLLAITASVTHYFSSCERNMRKKAETMSTENVSLYERINKFSTELEERLNKETADLKEEYKKLEMLYKISSEVSSDIELDKILESTIRGVREGLGFDRVGIFELDEDKGIIRGRLGVDKWGKPENIENQIYSTNPDDNNFAKIAAGRIDLFFTDNADSALPDSQRKYMITGVGQNAVVPMKAHGKVIGMIAVDNFITKRTITQDNINWLKTFANEAAAALNNAKMFGRERETAVRLRRLEELKSLFLSKMSHELKTPLASIKESVSILISKATGELLPAQLKFLNIAKNNTERLVLLIDELLDTAKMESRQLRLEIAPVSIAKIVDEVIYEIKPQADKKNIELISRVLPGNCMVKADKEKIFRVVSNLVKNSLKYTNEGGKVEISCQTRGSELLVEIADTGIGIDAKDLENIFEKFFQVNSPMVKESSGVGLGLSISKEIVEAHGGRIWAQSDGPEKGSTFIFSLPKE